MNADLFWKLIERSRKGTLDCEDQADRLAAILEKLEPSEICAFDELFHTHLNRAYRWDLWAVAYIVSGGCSDDGFEYFRSWLIGQGRAYFEDALDNPEVAVRRLRPGDEAECESLIYAAQQAYENVTGEEEIPPYKLARSEMPRGKRWTEEEVHLLYPRLARKFDYIPR